MAYVLMFINGEHGWSPDSIPLITEQSEEVNEVNQLTNEEIEMRRPNMSQSCNIIPIYFNNDQVILKLKKKYKLN